MSWGYAIKNGRHVFINATTGEMISKREVCTRMDNLDSMVDAFCRGLKAAQTPTKVEQYRAQWAASNPNPVFQKKANALSINDAATSDRLPGYRVNGEPTT